MQSDILLRNRTLIHTLIQTLAHPLVLHRRPTYRFSLEHL